MASEKQIVRVGLIGCGEVAQTVHIPTRNNFNELLKITYLCDVSPQALRHCASKVAGDAPRLTKDANELCSSPEVDVVFIINSTEYHVPHAMLALEHGKTAFIGKLMAMNNRDAQLLLDTEAKSKGRVMVGYMRRYATAFIEAVKEIGGVEAVTYARVRDIIGENGFFVDQSGTFPKKFTDYRAEDSQDLKARAQDLAEQGLSIDAGVPVTKESETMSSLLGSLGSHDLSVMREALGMPKRVLGCHLDPTKPFWTVLFRYPGSPVLYESGIDDIPRFDAHLEGYTKDKQVTVQDDTPYVKGLPVTMTVRENVDGACVERLVRKTDEDPYTLEYKDLYALATEGEPVKTTVQDAVNDLNIFRMIMGAGKDQSEK